VAVIGTGNSYLVKVHRKDGGGEYALRETRLPTLFDEACGLATRIVGGCLADPGTYSAGLEAAYVSGYDQQGTYRTLIYGLSEEPLDISNWRFNRILADVPQKNGILLLSADGRAAFFDGQDLAACQ
jgi:hypothetical protein